MAARKTKKMVEATQTFTYGDGYHVVRAGEYLSEDHPAVAANPAAFKESDLVRSEVEQTTAGPGEKRGA